MSERFSCKPILCIGLHKHDPNIDRRQYCKIIKELNKVDFFFCIFFIDFKEHQYFASQTIPGSGKKCVTSTAGWICPVAFIIRHLGKVT